ncbi:hypothetical protein CEXT_97131 [Caerostris extrusa]|uniref:Uncharacterized protein n=1 Tax=Caerostris extrusa TaxID=172846 RepID=A0AAV4ND23_CAEEX|nr:hypothetical protein CEXT_97131 [Caerostris extrusa]
MKDLRISVEKRESEEKLKPAISSENFPETEKKHLKNLKNIPSIVPSGAYLKPDEKFSEELKKIFNLLYPQIIWQKQIRKFRKWKK